MAKVYRSSQGKGIDLGALLLQNENVRAVGNMGVNARGDRIDNKNRSIDSRVQQKKRQYNKQIGPQDVAPSEKATPVVTPKPTVQAVTTKKPTVKKSTPKKKPAVKTQPTIDESIIDVTPEPKPAPVVAPTPEPVVKETTRIKPGGLADAIAKAKTIKQEQLKTPRQLAQNQQGVKKI